MSAAIVSWTAIDSTTIYDVKQIFQSYNDNDSFQSILDDEDFFNCICNIILRPIYRCATQSKGSRYDKCPPRRDRIQEIGVQEGIFQKPPSNPGHTATSEYTLSSNLTQECAGTSEHNPTLESSLSSNLTQECAGTSEHNLTLESSLSSERNATQSSLPDHATVPEISPLEQSETQESPLTSDILPERSTEPPSTPENPLRSGRTVSQERIETPESARVNNSASEDSLCSQHLSSPGDASTPRPCIPSFKPTLDNDLAPDSGIELSDTSSPPSSSATIKPPDSGIEPPDATSPPSATIELLDSGIELVDATPPPSYSATIELPANGIELSDATPPRSSATIEPPDSGSDTSVHIAGEDIAPLNSPQVETSGQDRTNLGQITIPECPYADRLNTKEIALEFESWTKDPKEFWERKSNTIGLQSEGDASTRLKIFVQDALGKRGSVNVQKIQYRFTSILVYQSFQKMMNTEYITSGLTQQYLKRIGISLEFESACMLLLHGGKNRIEFDHQIALDRDEIDHGPQCLPDLNDTMWDYVRDSRCRAKAGKTAAKLRSQDILSWSEASGAQSAAKGILLYGQELLDLVDWLIKRNRIGQKRGHEIVDQTTSSKVYFNKRLCTGFQNSRPDTNQTITTPRSSETPPAVNNSSTFTHANPAVFQPNRPTSESTEYPFDLSMRTSIFARAHSSPSLDSRLPCGTSQSIPSGTSQSIEDSIQWDEDAARNTNGYSDKHLANWEIPAVDALSSATAYDSSWYNGYNALLCDPEWYSRNLDSGSPKDSFNPQEFFGAMI